MPEQWRACRRHNSLARTCRCYVPKCNGRTGRRCSASSLEPRSQTFDYLLLIAQCRFPKSYDRPSGAPKHVSYLAIPALIGLYFCSPVDTMCSRQSKARRIAVPKITVDKHDDPMVGKNKVGLARERTAASPSANSVSAHDTN